MTNALIEHRFGSRESFSVGAEEELFLEGPFRAARFGAAAELPDAEGRLHPVSREPARSTSPGAPTAAGASA
jgi:hypothetical protein